MRYDTYEFTEPNGSDTDFYEDLVYRTSKKTVKVILHGSREFCELEQKKILFGFGFRKPKPVIIMKITK